jgi:hypothetical protein
VSWGGFSAQATHTAPTAHNYHLTIALNEDSGQIEAAVFVNSVITMGDANARTDAIWLTQLLNNQAGLYQQVACQLFFPAKKTKWLSFHIF